MIKLTPNQEEFVQGVVSGLSLADSYRQAYDTSNMSMSTVHKKASALWGQEKIRGRFIEIISQSSLLGVWTRESSFKERLWLLQETKRTIQDEGQVRQSTGTVYNQTLDAMDNLSFNDPRLKQAKAELEIKKLEQELLADENQDEKLSGYIEALKDVIKNEKNN